MNETDVIKNIMQRKPLNEGVIGGAADKLINLVTKLPGRDDTTYNTNPRLASGYVPPSSKIESFKLSPDAQSFKMQGTPGSVARGAAEIGVGLAARKQAERVGISDPWALTATEALGQVAGGRMMGYSPSIPGAFGGVGMMNLAAKPGQELGTSVAQKMGAKEGSWQEMLGGVAGSIGTSIPAYMAGHAAGTAVGNVATDAARKLAATKIGKPVASSLTKLGTKMGSSTLGRVAGGLARFAGPVAAAAAAAETGWSIGRLFGNRMTVGPSGLEWIGDKEDPETLAARGETEDMGVIDLAKQTLGYGTAGRAAALEKAEQKWAKQQGKQAQANVQSARAAAAKTQTERQTGELSPETISQAQKDLKERGVEGFKTAYSNDPQLMAWLQTQTKGTEMSLREQYYNHFMKMFNEEFSIETSAYGLTKNGKKRMAHYIANREKPENVYGPGDSSDGEDLEPETDTPKEIVTDPESFMKTAVGKLMSDNPNMTHGKAQQLALRMLKNKLGQQ